jgi:hypothetical protein
VGIVDGEHAGGGGAGLLERVAGFEHGDASAAAIELQSQ